jgi:hypothetical protein
VYAFRFVLYTCRCVLAYVLLPGEEEFNKLCD